MCLCGYCAYMYVYIPGVCLVPVEGFRSLGNEVTDGCKPPSGYWEPNLESFKTS